MGAYMRGALSKRKKNEKSGNLSAYYYSATERKTDKSKKTAKARPLCRYKKPQNDQT